MSSLQKIKSLIWTLLVSFMIAWHNVNHEENRMSNEIVIEIFIDNEQGDDSDY